MTGRHGGSGTFPPVPGPPFRAAALAVSARVLFLPVLLPLLLFSAVAWQVSSDGPLAEADERLTSALRADAPPASLAEFTADLGNVEVALPVLAAALGYAWLRGRRWVPPVTAALALAAVPALVAPSKALIDRPGPLGGTGYFPSGHAATAQIAYGAAVLLVLPYLPTWARRLSTAVAVLVCAAVGAGLVWRGYHWVLDVPASWCLGVPLLAAVRASCHRRGSRPGAAGPRTAGSGTSVTTTAAGIGRGTAVRTRARRRPPP